MTFKEKTNWFKRNPVTVARRVGYKYRVLKGSTVMMSGMHPIGEILNYDDKREFQQKGPEHMHVGIHIKGALKIDEDDDSQVTAFIDKYLNLLNPK